MITDFAYVIYPVSDLEKARGFYCEVLGLTPTGNWRGNWLELQSGSGTLVLTTRYAELGISPGAAGAVLALEVDDLSQYATLFEKHGVSWYIPPAEYEFCRGGTVMDPDGNRVLLHQKKPNQYRALQTTPGLRPVVSDRSRWAK